MSSDGPPEKPEKPTKPVPPKLVTPKPFTLVKPPGGAPAVTPASGKAAGLLAAQRAAGGGGAGASLLAPKKPGEGGGLLSVGSPRGSARGSAIGGARQALAKPGLGQIRKSFVGGGGYSGVGGFGSYFLEKQAVVLDFGNALTKIGFATECRPRYIIPSPQLRQRKRVSKGLTTTISEQEWIDVLDKFLNKVFFHYLCVSPKDRRVIICDPVQAPTAFRRALAFVLFKRFSVPAFALVSASVVPLYLTGLNAGIVIDMGYDCARVLATIAGIPVYSCYSTAQAGGRHLNYLLQKELQDIQPNGKPLIAGEWTHDETAIEDLKAQVCFVRVDVPAGNNSPAVTLGTDKDAIFMAPGLDKAAVTIPTRIRTEPCEVFFEGGAGGKAGDEANDSAHGEPGFYASLPEAFAETLEHVSVDVRGMVVQNIVLCGGSAMLPGFLPRLAVELQEELRSRDALKALADKLLFAPLDFAPLVAVWTGAAVAGALEGLPEYTAEDFEKDRPLPDWVSDGFL
eukprot:TRINITY_DN44701_c0_g1_i1.p1 TRINITY_DN44701_c0_g1~~TRINITY_DN44701_c0_g1_i1.p1  ORF type:complete len:511 (-),score=103.30 TRINITY_DN44701_c0_g1_i1:303-1835(-)